MVSMAHMCLSSRQISFMMSKIESEEYQVSSCFRSQWGQPARRSVCEWAPSTGRNTTTDHRTGSERCQTL